MPPQEIRVSAQSNLQPFDREDLVELWNDFEKSNPALMKALKNAYPGNDKFWTKGEWPRDKMYALVDIFKSIDLTIGPDTDANFNVLKNRIYDLRTSAYCKKNSKKIATENKQVTYTRPFKGGNRFVGYCMPKATEGLDDARQQFDDFRRQLINEAVATPLDIGTASETQIDQTQAQGSTSYAEGAGSAAGAGTGSAEGAGGAGEVDLTDDDRNDIAAFNVKLKQSNPALFDEFDADRKSRTREDDPYPWIRLIKTLPPNDPLLKPATTILNRLMGLTVSAQNSNTITSTVEMMYKRPFSQTSHPVVYFGKTNDIFDKKMNDFKVQLDKEQHYPPQSRADQSPDLKEGDTQPKKEDIDAYNAFIQRLGNIDSVVLAQFTYDINNNIAYVAPWLKLSRTFKKYPQFNDLQGFLTVLMTRMKQLTASKQFFDEGVKNLIGYSTTYPIAGGNLSGYYYCKDGNPELMDAKISNITLNATLQLSGIYQIGGGAPSDPQMGPSTSATYPNQAGGTNGVGQTGGSGAAQGGLGGAAPLYNISGPDPMAMTIPLLGRPLRCTRGQNAYMCYKYDGS